MGNAGILIVFSVVGAVICAKARVAGGAVIFSLIGLTLFVGTTAGSGLPGAVAEFLSVVDEMTTPALTDTEPAEAGTGGVG
jgi:hypothetical protein